MEQLARYENFGADKFPFAKRFSEFMQKLQTDINTQSKSKVPRLFNALQTDLQTLRPLAASPDQMALYNGVETKLNTFRSFAMNSGKWTWNSDLQLGMHTTHSPPAPPSPGSLTSACGELSGMPTCSVGATTDVITTVSWVPTTEIGTTTPLSTTASTQAQTTTTSPACSSDSDCSSLMCSLGQRAVCVAIGLGLHAYRECQCAASVDTNSLVTQTEPPGPVSSGSCTAGSDCSNIACPSSAEIGCVGYGLGEHAYSYCDCVTLPPPSPPPSALPPSSLQQPLLPPSSPQSPQSPLETSKLSTPAVVSTVPLTPPALSGCTFWVGPSGTSATCSFIRNF